MTDTPTFIPLPSDPNERMSPEQMVTFSAVLDANGGAAFRRKLVELATQQRLSTAEKGRSLCNDDTADLERAAATARNLKP